MMAFNLTRDHYVPEHQYLPNIKLEDDDVYYQLNESKYNPFVELSRLNNEFKMPPISSFCASPSLPGIINTNNGLRSDYLGSSDGECSPKSVDENEIVDNVMNSVSCIRGVRTITRNPGRLTRQRGGGAGKTRGRGRRNEQVLPKEKDRARLFNEAFDGLRKRIPSIPARKKLSKIEILRLAICYMSYLKFLIEKDLPQRTNPQNTTTNDTSLTCSRLQENHITSVQTSVVHEENMRLC